MRALISRSRALFVLTAVTLLAVVYNFTQTPGVKVMSIQTTSAQSSSAVAAPANVLLMDWEGPYGGVPLRPCSGGAVQTCLEAGMAENLVEVERIAKDRRRRHSKTRSRLERTGQTLDRVQTIYGVFVSTMNSPDVQVVQREMAPRLAAFSDQITQNETLFKRIEAVYNSPEKAKFTPEQQRLIWLYYTNFVRAGARLAPDAKARLSQINQQLAGLYTKFGQNVLAEEDGQFIVLKGEADLAGLPQSVRDAAAAAAATKKQTDAWVIMNTRSSVDPFLTYSDRRDLREKAWLMFVNRGDNGDEHDNNATITQILQLRAERAKLLGYPTHAHWRLENAMAKNPENAMELMVQVWKPAVARVHEEVADMQALANKEGAKIKIEPWDYRYYAEKVRKARYDLDQNEVKQYLQLEKLREGIFWVAGQLFNFDFTPATNVPVVHPDVRVWEVTDKTTKQHIGLWYFDPYARAGKRSGAG